MLIATMCRYGVRALFDLAYYGDGKPLQIKEISERQCISPRYLEQIFHRMLKSGFIASKRGPRGGYLLKVHPSEISLLDVIEKIQGPIQFADCSKRRKIKKPCKMMGECVTIEVWNEAKENLREYFSTITIQTLCDRYDKQAKAK